MIIMYKVFNWLITTNGKIIAKILFSWLIYISNLWLVSISRILSCDWSSVESWVVIGWWWVTCSWTRAQCCRIVCRRSHWRRWWTCQCRWDTGLESGERTRTWTVWTRTGSQDSLHLVWEQTSLAERICLPHSDNTSWSGGHRWRSDTRIYDEKYFTFDLSA